MFILFYLNNLNNLDFSVQIFTSSDPMYITVNILADRINQNIYIVNLIISLLFSSIFLF